MIISVNGRITDEKKAVIPVAGDAFLFGRAVFETLRTYRGKVFRLRNHVTRLYASAEVMGIKKKPSFAEVEKALRPVLLKNPGGEARIRIILTSDDLIITSEPLNEKPAAMYRKGIKLVSFPGKRNLPQAKKLGDAFCFAAHQHALRSGAYDALLVAPDMYVPECAYANIFWVKNSRLYTTANDVLLGITRETVIELADGNVRLKDVKYKSLLAADEIFITQTTSGILPVTQIDGHKIGIGKPGPVTKKLMEKFGQLITNN